MKKILDNKIISKLFTVIESLICIVLIVLILLTGFQRFSNQGSFFGFRIYTVASGSMIPTYNVGDTLLIEDMPASKIKVGDAVTYQADTAGVKNMIITHQVIDIEKDENGKYLFHTKGIANNIEDPIVYEDQVLGKVVYRFAILSILGRLTTNMTSLLVFITVPIAILIAIEIIKIVYKKDDEEDEESDIIKEDKELAKSDDDKKDESSDDKNEDIESEENTAIESSSEIEEDENETDDENETSESEEVEETEEK